MKLVTLVFIAYVFQGCDPHRTTIYSTQDCNGNYQPSNLSSITSSVQKYDSSYVEVTGFYQDGPEESAISNSNFGLYKSSMLWVDFNFSLVDSLEKSKINNESVFEKLSGKKIKIRGIIYSKDGGHLDQYAATVKNVCYLEIYKW